MMDEYITRNNVISAVCFGCNQEFSDEPCEPSECAIRQSIMALPTADVVPKSEVAKEFTCFVGDPHKVEHCPYLDEIEKAKTDVAREIFEEIANICKKYFEQCSREPDCKLKQMLQQGERFVINEMWHEFAELKKKYTEGET